MRFRAAISLISIVSAALADPNAITHPGWGDRVNAGSIFTIKWIPDPTIQSVNLLWQAGDVDNLQPVATLVSNYPNVGQFAWSVPLDARMNSAYVIAIQNAANKDQINYSTYFTVIDQARVQQVINSGVASVSSELRSVARAVSTALASAAVEASTLQSALPSRASQLVSSLRSVDSAILAAVSSDAASVRSKIAPSAESLRSSVLREITSAEGVASSEISNLQASFTSELASRSASRASLNTTAARTSAHATSSAEQSLTSSSPPPVSKTNVRASASSMSPAGNVGPLVGLSVMPLFIGAAALLA